MPDTKLIDLHKLESELSNKIKLLPVHSWHPERTDTIDIRIMRDGRWIHEGGEIKRPELVRLFASVLRLDKDGYYLVTPVEKLLIDVVDAPFVVTSVMQREDPQGRSVLMMQTNIGEQVLVGDKHQLRIAYNANKEPSPYVHIRDGLEALLLRSVFYDLVELGKIRDDELVVESAGQIFILGSIN